MENFENLSLYMESLIVFRNILKDETINVLIEIIAAIGKPDKSILGSYSTFVNKLLQTSNNLTRYVWGQIIKDENIYVLTVSKKEKPCLTMEKCLANELHILQQFASIKSDDIIKYIPFNGFLPGWNNSEMDFEKEYRERMNNIEKLGYGIFINNLMFVFDNNKLLPVKSPDPIKLSNLSGYEEPRNKVIDNTLALLEGRFSSNVLLYGDGGTGKSSTIKAIVNEYGSLGLRLIEVRKAQLLAIPALMENLSYNPLKFIIFIDDLSFTQNNEEIGALKAILEGSVTKRASNIVIYATSNRRRLIKETFSDRGNDDINRNETIQEQTSLSERFGLSVSFFKPDKNEYLNIVFELAKQYKLKNTDNLELLAERHALERGGRSGRCARQLIEYLKSIEVV